MESRHRKTKGISIHALREEGDHGNRAHRRIHHHISIHALREEGDIGSTAQDTTTTDFYPRPPRGGRQWMAQEMERADCISIHALREEGDL